MRVRSYKTDRSSAGLAARRYWVGTFATVENAAALEWWIAVTATSWNGASSWIPHQQR